MKCIMKIEPQMKIIYSNQYWNIPKCPVWFIVINGCVFGYDVMRKVLKHD